MAKKAKRNYAKDHERATPVSLLCDIVVANGCIDMTTLAANGSHPSELRIEEELVCSRQWVIIDVPKHVHYLQWHQC